MKTKGRFLLWLFSLLLITGCWPVKHGLIPIYPANGDTVSSLNPTFTWEPYIDVKDGKENIRYMLIIKDGTTTVESSGVIQQTSYAAKYDLSPKKKYTWLVRPIWTRNNHTEAGEWSYKVWYYVTPIVWGHTGARYYSFITPDTGADNSKKVSIEKPAEPNAAVSALPVKNGSNKRTETDNAANKTDLNEESTRLENLKNLRERGLITQEEYDKKRKEILDAM